MLHEPIGFTYTVIFIVIHLSCICGPSCPISIYFEEVDLSTKTSINESYFFPVSF